jgi:tetratricopeptide (TPR) repeat protein
LDIQHIQVADAQNTITQDPKLIIVQINYAKTLVNIGQYELAITTYNGILQGDPYNGCALFGKAEALDKSGQHGEAVKNYDIAKKLSPTCSNDTINIQKKVSQPSQIGALAEGFSLLLSHR